MKEKVYVEILDSFSIGPSKLLIVYLKNPGFALKKGFFLQSEASGHRWEIYNRYLDYYTQEKEEVFEGEEIAIVRSKPKSTDIASYVQNILDRDRKREFMYRLLGIGHSDKPEQGEKLVLLKT